MGGMISKRIVNFKILTLTYKATKTLCVLCASARGYECHRSNTDCNGVLLL